MTREEEIRARLKNAETFDAVLPLNNRHHRGEIRSGKRIVARMEPETLHSLGDLLAHAPADIRYLLEKVERLEKPTVESVSAAFAKLTDDDRSDVVAGYCRSCWRNDPDCQCSNDE